MNTFSSTECLLLFVLGFLLSHYRHVFFFFELFFKLFVLVLLQFLISSLQNLIVTSMFRLHFDLISLNTAATTSIWSKLSVSCSGTC